MIRIGWLFVYLVASLCAGAQTVIPGPAQFQRLFEVEQSSGNGADVTEDVLANCSAYTLPAAQLANIGDAINVVAGGTMASSTDAKTARLKVAGTTMQSANGSTASATQWQINLWLIKRGTNQQTSSGWALVNNAAVAVGASNAIAFTDTGTLAITVTGQNNTNPVSGSVACGYMTVDFVKGV